jgi:hypothetical protein
MRVIITGGTGLIGSALAADLIKDKHEVIVLSRNPYAFEGLLAQGVRLEKWDGKTPQGWGKLVEECDAIVNLAGENISGGRWTSHRKTAIVDSRWYAGRAITLAIKDAVRKPSMLIQSSAIGYYGPAGDQIITEETPHGQGFVSQVAIRWEDSSKQVETFGVRRAIIRSGVALSLGYGALPRMLLPFKFYVGGPIGSGKQWFSWIHLADLVAGIRFLIDHPETSGAYNLTSPNPMTNKEFANAIGKAMHRPALLPVPEFALKAAFGEMASVLLDSQRVVPKRLEEAGMKFRFPDALPALQDLFKE